MGTMRTLIQRSLGIVALGICFSLTEMNPALAADQGEAQVSEVSKIGEPGLPGLGKLGEVAQTSVEIPRKEAGAPGAREKQMLKSVGEWERDKILPLDFIALDVHPHEQFSAKVQVEKDGTIFYQPVGEVSVAGLTVEELEQKMTGLLGEYLQKPEVRITLKREKQKESSAMVLGEVKNPGSIPLAEQGMTLMEAVEAAGGFTDHAYLEKVSLRRDFGNRDREMFLNVQDVVEGREKDSVIIEPGDLVTVPRVETEKQKVSTVVVLGEVKTPGTFPLSEMGVTFMEAIRLAGGFTQDAEIDKVSLRRDFGNRDREMFIHARDILEGKTADTVFVEAGDLITVEKRLNQVVIVGQVEKPGAQELSPGMTLMEAIGTAGGFTKFARLGKVKVTRKEEGKIRVFEVNVKDVMNGKAEDSALMPGDLITVPERRF